MKNLFAALAAIMFILPASVRAAEPATTLTRFGGEKITGVSASHDFDVKLVKSNETKAVVTIDSRLEKYLELSMEDGVVCVGLKNQNGFSNLFRDNDDRTLDLTLYLPELRTVRLSGGADLTSSDTFGAPDAMGLDIMLSGGSEIDRLVYSGYLMKVQASGGSDAELTHNATGLSPESSTIVMASGGSEVDIRTTGVWYTKLNASGGSDITIKGNCDKGDWTASGGADIEGDEDFTVRELGANALGAGTIEANVSEVLNATASGAGEVLFRGQPKVNTNSRNRSVRRM